MKKDKKVQGENMKYKKYDYDGYQIYTIQTDKFKSCYMELIFRDDARKVNATKRNFLTNLMTYTSKAYPTKRDMIIRSEELYNLSLSGELNRSGYNLLTSFNIDFLHPKFVEEKDYLENAITFLLDTIKNPNIEEDKFQERSFQIIKERLKVRLNQYKEKPHSYALIESKKALFGDSISGTRILGDEQELEKITREEVAKEYEDMLENSHCEILIIGDLDMDKVVSIIKKNFYKPSIPLNQIPFVVENKIQPYHELEVESNYHQTQLLLYYQSEMLTYFERNFVGPIFYKILANAGMADKLTKALRVENSLCYTCGAQINPRDLFGLMSTGLSLKNVPLALEKMRECMKEMQEGKIEESFLTQQKEKFLSDLQLREDNLYGLITNYYFHEIADLALYKEYIEEIPKVTIEDIKTLAQKMHESFLYVLKEAQNEKN